MSDDTTNKTEEPEIPTEGVIETYVGNLWLKAKWKVNGPDSLYMCNLDGEVMVVNGVKYYASANLTFLHLDPDGNVKPEVPGRFYVAPHTQNVYDDDSKVIGKKYNLSDTFRTGLYAKRTDYKPASESAQKKLIEFFEKAARKLTKSPSWQQISAGGALAYLQQQYDSAYQEALKLEEKLDEKRAEAQVLLDKINQLKEKQS